LSKQLGLSVIAEGIENRASADLLLTMGCEEGQGYFFGKPMPVGELEDKYNLRGSLRECPQPGSNNSAKRSDAIIP
jgi:EAL domain-containing protein (putative c-di-GMP-specific phosphodiesterase class I)